MCNTLGYVYIYIYYLPRYSKIPNAAADQIVKRYYSIGRRCSFLHSATHPATTTAGRREILRSPVAGGFAL